MSTVAEIEAAISRLPLQQAAEVSEWLEHCLEDQRELSPEFVASIERGKADLAAGRVRVPRVSYARRGNAGFFTRV
jgi:hypothetical protein